MTAYAAILLSRCTNFMFGGKSVPFEGTMLTPHACTSTALPNGRSSFEIDSMLSFCNGKLPRNHGVCTPGLLCLMHDNPQALNGYFYSTISSIVHTVWDMFNAARISLCQAEPLGTKP